MRLRAIKLLLIAAAFGLAGSHSPPGTAAENPVTTKNFIVTYENIERPVVEAFASDAEKEFSIITTYLGRRPSRSIRISISDRYLFPRYKKGKQSDDATIFVPAERIRENANAATRLKKRGTGLLLVMTPIIAPSTNKPWGEFLETGLRTYVQEKLGREGLIAFPTMGLDLHEATGRLAADYGKFIPLAKAEEARTWRTRMTRTRRLAYLEAGSFVRYLVEQHGLEKFMAWYDGQRFEDVYSRNLTVMEEAWKRYVKTIRPQPHNSKSQ